MNSLQGATLGGSFTYRYSCTCTKYSFSLIADAVDQLGGFGEEQSFFYYSHSSYEIYALLCQDTVSVQMYFVPHLPLSLWAFDTTDVQNP